MPRIADRMGGDHTSGGYAGRESYEGFGGYNRNLLHAAPHGGTVRASIGMRTKRTWDGVFLPVSLSIFGFVLFARLPWIVGQCGLWLTLVAIALCYTVTCFTTISLAAISTNGFTGDGGPYMMISRCLGPQIGTTVGLTFVIANVVATAMYLVGGVSVVVNVFSFSGLSEWHNESPYLSTVVVSSMMLLSLLVIAFLRVEKVFRLVCIVLTLLSIIDVFTFILRSRDVRMPEESPSIANVSTSHVFLGISRATFEANWSPQFANGHNMQSVLSVLFPGVSGVMSGVCLSGDLKNGAKAMPRGIAYAWVLSLVTYVLVALCVAASMDRHILQQHYNVLRYASDPIAFLPGEFCASFAAGLSMMIGSSRVLRAIARDELLPFWWVKRLAHSSPKLCVMVYWASIQALLFLGDSYVYASAFAAQVFLANFMALNLSTFLSSVTGMASFRPVYSFFNTTTAFIGAFLCLVVMFFVNPLVAAAVLILMGVLLVVADLYIDQRRVYWGDASQPLFFYIVRKWLLRLDERKEHIRHWRPSILHVVTDPLCSLNLVHMANNLKKGGLYELCLTVGGSFRETVSTCHRWKGWLLDFISASGIKAFGVVTFGETLRASTQNLLRTSGIGGMHTNTVLLSLDEVLQREYFHKIYDSYSGAVTSFNSANALLGPIATDADFGAARPLKDVCSRQTEFWDLKRDAKGQFVGSAAHFEDKNNERRNKYGKHSSAEPPKSKPIAVSHWSPLVVSDERTKLLSATTDAVDSDSSGNDCSGPLRQRRLSSQEEGDERAAQARMSALRQRRLSEAAHQPSLDLDNMAGSMRFVGRRVLKSRTSQLVDATSACLNHTSIAKDDMSYGGARLTSGLSDAHTANRFREPHASALDESVCGRSEAPAVVCSGPSAGSLSRRQPAVSPDPLEVTIARMSTMMINREMRQVGGVASAGPSANTSPNVVARAVALSSSPASCRGAELSAPDDRTRLKPPRTSKKGTPKQKAQTKSETASRQELEEIDPLCVSIMVVESDDSAGDDASTHGSSSSGSVTLTVPDPEVVAHRATTAPDIFCSRSDRSEGIQPHAAVSAVRKTAEEFSQFLRKTMHGHFEGNPSTTHHSRTASVPVTLDGASDSDAATHAFLRQTIEKAHEIKKPSGWGLFRTARVKANEGLEQSLLERMIAQRHVARLTGDYDLNTFSDITEFCSICQDVSAMHMNLLLARNVDKLDMEMFSKRKAGEIFIDVWVPHDSDAILFLMSYCFSMTSLWRKRGCLRVISVVTLSDEVPEEQKRVRALLAEHRIHAQVVVLSLEPEMAQRGITHPDDIEKMFESQSGRATVMNSLMRRECERTKWSTAVIFMRVESYSGPAPPEEAHVAAAAADDAAEEWFANLVTLTHQLPTMMLLAGGNLKCRSNDW